MSDIEFVKRVIRVHCAEIRSIKDAARFTNYSAETIRRDFVRSEHMPLSEYITRIRVEMAKRLLETTEMSCQKTCEAVGFSRADVGARAFKKFTGNTMKGYRDLSSVKEIQSSKLFTLQVLKDRRPAKVNR